MDALSEELEKLLAARVRIWNEMKEAGSLPPLIQRWLWECKHHKCSERPDYAKMRRILEGGAFTMAEE